MPLAHLERLAQQIMCGQTLQHHRRCRLVFNPVRKLYNFLSTNVSLFRIAAEIRNIGHAITNLEATDLFSDSDHLTRRFVARNIGK